MPRATRSARPTSRVKIEPGQAVLGVVGQSRPRRPRRRTASPRPPGRTPPRARSALAGRRRAPRSAAPRSPAPSGAEPANATSTLVDVPLHRAALLRGDQRPHLAGSVGAGRAPPCPSTAGSSSRGTRRTPTARPGSGSGRSSPGRRCRRRRTAPRRPRPARSASAKMTLALLPPSSRVHPLHLVGAAGHDPLADLGGAGEADLAHQRVGDEPLADDRALAGDHGEHALGQPGLQRQLAEPDRGQRGELGRLEHDGVAGGQRGRQAPARRSASGSSTAR